MQPSIVTHHDPIERAAGAAPPRFASGTYVIIAVRDVTERRKIGARPRGGIASLANELLDVSRMRLGGLELHPEPPAPWRVLSLDSGR